MPTGGLPASGKKIFEKVYQEAKKAGKSEEYAAKVAWTAVKNAGWKKNDAGEWVKGKSEVQEFSMSIIKAAFDKENQVMRWRAVASDTESDLYDERMSMDLFNDFTSRIKSKEQVPAPFDSVICEDSWCGGIPYLSVAHYKAGEGARNVPGKIDEDGIYIDGNRLKAKGTLHDNQMGFATFKSLCEDLSVQKRNDPNHVPVRISIGFLDLQHKHVADSGGQDFTFTRTDLGQICPLCAQGIGNKIYTKGQLVHLAMTRVPVNPRTLMEVDKSMDIITKKDDAKSIIGDLSDDLEEKSLADDVLVIKADGSTIKPDEDKYDSCYDPNTDSFNQECLDNLLEANSVELRDGMEAVKAETRKRVLAKSLAKLETTYKSHGLAWPVGAKPVVEESMNLGGKTVDEKKFEFEGVHGDPMQDMKKAPMKAKPDEKETPEEDAKETKKDEEAEDKKMKSLDAAYNAFKSRLGEDVSVEKLNAAFQDFGKGVEKAFTPEPK
ncbi:MAG TPA: ChaB family protein, partial [Candidatus Paceibacterota bacterium]